MTRINIEPTDRPSDSRQDINDNFEELYDKSDNVYTKSEADSAFVENSQIDTTDTLGTSDTKIPSQKAVKTYADTKLSSASVLAGINISPLFAPQGFLINGKFVPSVASNNLTVALKTLAGTDPSTTDPIYVRIGDTVRTISAALSVTKNAATNWFNAGSAELATKEIDYFVYLGYNATDGVTIGFSRIPGANQYSSFSVTTTNEKYCAISTITTAVATDYYENVGRFAATLSAGAGYTWTVPTYTALNLIQRPIYQTRQLSSVGTITGFTANPAITATYQIINDSLYFHCESVTSSTSNATTMTIAIPFAALVKNYFIIPESKDNGSYQATTANGTITAGASIINTYKTMAEGAWTASGLKGFEVFDVKYKI